MWLFANDCLQTSWGFCPEEEPESISSTPRHSSWVKTGQDKLRSQFRGPWGWRLGRGLGRGARGGVGASKFPPICLWRPGHPSGLCHGLAGRWSPCAARAQKFAPRKAWIRGNAELRGCGHILWVLTPGWVRRWRRSPQAVGPPFPLFSLAIWMQMDLGTVTLRWFLAHFHPSPHTFLSQHSSRTFSVSPAAAIHFLPLHHSRCHATRVSTQT